MGNRDMDVCNFCHEESEYTMIIYHKIGSKIYEPIPTCPRCLYERGKYDALKPEYNCFNEEALPTERNEGMGTA